MVKAIAPNAPIGAAFMTIATSLKTAIAASSRKSSSALAALADERQAMPNRIATNRTWRMLPAASAGQEAVGDDAEQEAGQRRIVRLGGIIGDLAGIERGGVDVEPAPGRMTLPTIRPTISARVEKNRK